MEQLKSHLWITASSYMAKYLRIFFSYMTLQLFHSEFPYIWGKFYFLFYQCTVHTVLELTCLSSSFLRSPSTSRAFLISSSLVVMALLSSVCTQNPPCFWSLHRSCLCLPGAQIKKLNLCTLFQNPVNVWCFYATVEDITHFTKQGWFYNFLVRSDVWNLKWCLKFKTSLRDVVNFKHHCMSLMPCNGPKSLGPLKKSRFCARTI